MTDRARPAAVSSCGYLDYDYDRFYASHDFDYVEQVEAAFLRAVLQGLVRLPTGASIVDLGCGTGFDTWLMDRMGYRALGVDVSGVAIEKARRRDGGAGFVWGDALAAPERLGSDYDLAYCSGFMAFNWVDSLDEPRARAAARTLLDYVRPGGWLIFVWDSILSGERWSPYADLEPDRMFMNYTVAQVRDLWEALGGCRVRHAVATHKRLAPYLGRASFSPAVNAVLSPLARLLRRPVQILVTVERAPEPASDDGRP